MARSSNALWIGAIVIVAALTAVELLSSRDSDDTAGDAGYTVDATPAAPAQPHTSQIASGAISAPDTEDAFVDVLDPATDFDPSVFEAPDLIVNLDNPEADMAPFSDTDNDEENATDQTHELTGTDTMADEKANDATIAAVVNEVVTEPVAATPPVETPAAVAAIEPAAAPAAMETTAAPDLAHHLAAAERAMKELRLTTPEGDSAYDHYQAILAAEPGNAKAQAGMQKIVDMYVYFVEKAITDRKPQRARVYLQRAESLKPESARLKDLRVQLD